MHTEVVACKIHCFVLLLTKPALNWSRELVSVGQLGSHDVLDVSYPAGSASGLVDAGDGVY